MKLNDEAGAGNARPLDNRTLWEQVRDRLREDILAGRLEPGTELSEVALARDFIDAYQVREALETFAVRLAVPLMSDAELAHLRELCELMARAAREDEVRLFFDTNNSFHEALVRGSRNQKLYELHRVLVGQMVPYLPRSLELRGNLLQSVEEHEAILAAIDARDAERAAELMAEHIEVPQRVVESDAGQALFRADTHLARDTDQ